MTWRRDPGRRNKSGLSVVMGVFLWSQIFCVSALVAGSAIYDGFEYAETVLPSPWSASPGTSTASDMQLTNGLAFKRYGSLGQAVWFASAKPYAYSALSTNYDPSPGSASTTTVWVGFLIRRYGGGNQVSSDLLGVGLAGSLYGNLHLVAGIVADTVDPNIGRFAAGYKSEWSSLSLTRNTSLTVDEGTNYFVLARCDLSGAAAGTITINVRLKAYAAGSALPTAEPATWDVEHSATDTWPVNNAALSIDRVKIIGRSGGSNQQPVVDEIRVGDSFRDALLPVRVPSGLLLVIQ